MGQSKWYVCAHADELDQLILALRRAYPKAVLVPVSEPLQLRIALLSEPIGEPSVAIATNTSSVSAVNLAAAVVADGHAAQVLLVCDEASGSLRSRAQRAGISRVVDLSELSAAGSVTASHVAVRMGKAGAAPLPAAESSAPELPELIRKADSGKIVVVASGRGGTGKSALAAVAAAAAASWDMRVALVDLDLSSGNLFGYFGLPGAADLTKLAHTGVTEQSVASVGCHISEHLSLWGPCEKPEAAELVTPHVKNLLTHLSNTHDLVVVDSSSTWTDAVAEAAQDCDRLVLVADERAGAIASMARMGALAVRLGVARTRICRVTNRCELGRGDESFVLRADMGLEVARSFKVLDGGIEVAELLSAGNAVELAALKSDFSDSVASCIAKLLLEMGCLPSHKAAERASQWHEKRHGLFSRMREAG